MPMLQEQFKKNSVALSIAYLPCLIFFTVLTLQNTIPISYLTRDPPEIMSVSFYIGFVSNLGILLWSGAAAISLFTALVLCHAGHRKTVTLYFLATACVTLILLFDDLLIIHERFGPNRLHIPQPLIMVGYALMFLLYLIVFRATILRMNLVFLSLFFVFIGLSTISDALSDAVPGLKNHVIEDGAKFFGIVSWLTYIALGAFAQIREAIRDRDGVSISCTVEPCCTCRKV